MAPAGWAVGIPPTQNDTAGGTRHPPRLTRRSVRVQPGLSVGGSARRPMSTITDPSTELMLRVRDGDAEAFEQLVGLWQDRLVTLFLHQTGDRATAEDLAQEVFLRVYRARASYRPTAKFTTWVHTIANNIASDLRQRAYRRKERGVPTNTSASNSQIGLEQLAVAASGLLPHRQLDRGELQAVVQQAIASLSDRQRMVVLLAKFEQCSYEEIAASMKLTVPAVKSLLFRAREQLRQALAPYLGEAAP
jgi:RNA polymerase sigma-70 factor (ECF subfamily)